MSRPVPPLKTLVSDLIGTPSVSSTQDEFDMSNEAVINLLADWLERMGFDVSVSNIINKPGKYNLIARLGAGPAPEEGSAGGLLLSGHSDTVPFDEHLWQSDPFVMKEADDRWYGLGSCDMKSFFALAIEAALPFLDSPLKKPLTIMATADEESSMCGAKQLTRNDLVGADYAVIGEPTDMRPVTCHKGIWMMNLRIEGTSGHSSDPSLGRNAIEGMHRALNELMDFRREMADRHRHAQFAVAYPTLNFGSIHGGDNPNRICDHAELEFDLRNLPSQDMTGFIEDLESRIRASVEGFDCQLRLLHSPVPAFDNPDSALVETIEKLTGQSRTSVAFGTEAPFLKDLSIDTVVIGPGSIDQAHQPDEYLSQAQINPGVDLLQNLIRQYCL